MTITWLIINCNSSAEATKIGTALLKKRWIACYDVLPRTSGYYWPPKKGKITKGKGTMLMAVTLPRHIPRAMKLAGNKHSDDVPFMATTEVHNVPHAYYKWVTGELASHV